MTGSFSGIQTKQQWKSTARWNAKLGKFFRADRILTNDGYKTELTDITDGLIAEPPAIDIGNLKVGYGRFDNGVDIVVQHRALGIARKPGEAYKPCLQIELWLPGSLAEGDPLREMTAASMSGIDALNDLGALWEAGAEDVDEQARISCEVVPRVGISVAEIEGKMGKFYKPEFTIDSWIPRPSTWPNEDQGGVGLTAPLPQAPSVPGTEGDSDLPF